MNKIELLAPAKNVELGKIAIDHGADAVYIAGPHFGARQAAGNPISDIETLVKYAHKYYAKVYLTENTIIYENELDQARKLATDAYNSGCDAIIVQDMSFMKMDLPPIPLFASTQTNNTNAQQVKFLQDIGFQRVILARELSLQEISKIKNETTVDLEVFVHGSLCVSYSGQCYLSQALTNRSANRGCCSQPCRSRYDLEDKNGKIIAKNKHLLSLQDLNLSNNLAELIQAGISSFKIEGRLKDESYIKNVVGFYRQKLDQIINSTNLYKKSSSGKIQLLFDPNPEMSFSRRFTTYFFDKKQNKMASPDTAKSLGEKIGTVQKIYKNYFKTESSNTLQNGDGICFLDKKGNLEGTKINKVDKDKIYPLSMSKIEKNIEIFRNFNHLFEKQMKKKTAIRKINAEIKISKNNHNKIVIEARDEDANIVSMEIQQNGDTAKNNQLAVDNIKKNIEHKDAGIFKFTVTIQMKNILFFPVSQINEWRKKITELLTIEREKNYKSIVKKNIKKVVKYHTNTLTYTGNISNSLSAKLYKQCGVKNISRAFELEKPKNQCVLMTTKYCIRRELEICKKNNAEDLFLINNGKKLRVIFDCSRCQMKIVKDAR